MTIQQLHLFNGAYLVVLAAVAVLTRATWWRLGGALAGGVAFGLFALGGILLGEWAGWWHFTITWAPYYLTLFLVDFALPVAVILLATWRVERRFSWRGLAVVVAAMVAVGPPRDYWYMMRFPEWGAYGPGVAPFLAVAALYASLVPLGQSVMRLVAGPGQGSPLARRPWEKAVARAKAG